MKEKVDMIKEDNKDLLKFNAEGIHPADMFLNAKDKAVKAGGSLLMLGLGWFDMGDPCRLSDSPMNSI